MLFSEFLQGVTMIGLYTWPIWVLGGIIVILDLMENKDRQRGKL
jgi:hypothetical protein